MRESVVPRLVLYERGKNRNVRCAAGMKSLRSARLGYARVTGERVVEAGSAIPCGREQSRVGRHLSPAPLGGVATAQRCESGAVRQGAIRNRGLAESGERGVSIRPPTQFPQRDMAATVQTGTERRVLVGLPRQKGPARKGRVRKRRGASGSDRARQSPENLLPWGGAKNHVTQLRYEMQPES
jgi:hypothetical protein